jgi:signal transduction histidine kinase
MSGAFQDLDVTFSPRSFAPEGTVSFRYRLVGADRAAAGEGGAWIDLGPARTIHHARLGPGDYRLAIAARSREGDWSAQPAQLGFSLRPPFHRSPTFYLLLVAAGAAVLLGGHRLRLRRARAELHTVMAERSRIAREIHDTLAQAFVATSVQLECLEEALETDPRARDNPAGDRIRHHLGTAKQVVEESLEEARRAVWVLRPQAIEPGLVAALETLVRRVSGTTTVDLAVVGVARPLSPLVASNLLRIAQEAVANAHRHGRAGRITLRLAFSPASVTLTVNDDGQGMGQADDRPNSGMGILGMKERAAQIGGTLTIEPAPARDPAAAPARGTCVRIEVAA